MNLWLRNFILLALMLAASGMAVALRPTLKIADQGPKVDLETLIPLTFSDWREEKQSTAQIIDPEQKEMLNQIYSQMLSRTYVNDKGYRIMLSLAYGGDQSRNMQVHRPEVCYAAQGFRISGTQKVELKADGLSIPAMRVETHLGSRVEPVTYWLRIGTQLVRGNIELGLARTFYYGLRGQIADGLLFRVSSIDGDSHNAYLQQDKFINDLLEAIPAEDKSAVIGGLKERS